MGRGSPGVRAGHHSALGADEAARLAEANGGRLGGPNPVPFDVDGLHDIIDEVARRVAQPDCVETYVRSTPTAIAEATDDADLERLVKQADAVREDLSSLMAQMSTLTTQLSGFYHDLWSRRYELEKRATKICNDREARRVRAGMNDLATVADIISGTIALPDDFPLSRLPLATRTGTPLMITSYVPLWDTNGAYRVVRTCGELRSGWAAGWRNNRPQECISVEYRAASRRVKLLVTEIFIPRALLASAVAAFIIEQQGSPAPTAP